MRYIAAAVLAFFAAPTFGCSWAGLSPENVATALAPRLKYADAVVHAKVVAVRVLASDGENPDGSVTVQLEKQIATLEVLRSFKGGASRMEVAGLTTMCGYQFSVGEENVYFISKGRVGIPNVEPASSWLLAALERAAKAPPNTSLERTRER
jgi:hypothetical protein